MAQRHADCRCAWRVQGATVDSDHVHAQLVNTMREILTVRSWWQLPRFVYGSSRGGAMALIMAQRFPFQVRCIQLSAKVFRLIKFQCLAARLFLTSCAIASVAAFMKQTHFFLNGPEDQFLWAFVHFCVRTTNGHNLL